MIDIPKDNRNRHDIYLLFKRNEDVKKFLENKTIPENARFKAEDYIDAETGEIEHNNTSHLSTRLLTIITSATLDFNDNDYVYDVKYKLIWRIQKAIVSDDGQMKEYSLRPRKDTIISLIR